MLSAASYITAMRHAAGVTIDPRVDPWQIFNEAGRSLVTAHAWSWRDASASVTSVEDQAWVDLPWGFGRLLSISRSDGMTPVFHTTKQEIDTLNTVAAGGLGDLHVCVDGFAPPSGRTPPRPRMWVYPIPTSSDDWTLNIAYRAEWSEIWSDDETRRPAIPLSFEEPLRLLCRAMIVEAVNPNDMAPDRARYEAALARLRAEDGARRPVIGQLPRTVNFSPTYDLPREISSDGVSL